MNTILSAQTDSACGASYGVRDQAHTNRRNGYRRRDLDSRMGTLDVAMSRTRSPRTSPERKPHHPASSSGTRRSAGTAATHRLSWSSVSTSISRALSFWLAAFARQGFTATKPSSTASLKIDLSNP